MSSPLRTIWKQVMPVLAGVLAAVAVVIPMSLFGVLMGISDGRGESKQPIAIGIIATGLIIGMLVGGYMTASLSRTKKLLPVICTGVILASLYIWNSDPAIYDFSTIEIIILILIIPLTCIGGWWGIRRIKQ